MSVMRRTGLHTLHVALGATMAPFAGWDMPLRYGSDLAEHHAVRQHAGLFDLGHMGQIEVSGPDAGVGLDRALAGGISTIAVGRARYTMMLNAHGGVVDDLIVYRLDDQRFLVVANATNRATVVAELHQRLAANVMEREDTGLLALQGPVAQGVLARLGVKGLDDLGYYGLMHAQLDGVAMAIARTGYTGEDGFELFVADADLARVFSTLMDAGEPVGVLACGLACRDTLRLEAGMPLYGHELTAEHTPFHAGLQRVLRFDDPFIGRDALQRWREEPTERTLVGLRATGRRAARPATALYASSAGTHDDGTADERHATGILAGDAVGPRSSVGEVTSGALSPTLGHPIAMAYVDRQFAGTGGTLVADVRGQDLVMTVVDLPFYRRSR